MSEEYSEKIREATFLDWLSRNPGKTRDDYERYRLQEDALQKEREVRKLTDKATRIGENIGLFLLAAFRYALLPAIAAWALGFILPAIGFGARFSCAVVLMVVLRLFLGR